MCAVFYIPTTPGAQAAANALCYAKCSAECSALRSTFVPSPPKGGGQGPRPESEISSRVIAVGAFSKWVGEALGGTPFKITGGPHNRGPRF